MNDILRAFGRAVVSQLHPRMLMLTVIPFVLATALWGGLIWWGWDPIMGTARALLEGSVFTSWIYSMLDWLGLQSLRTVVAPLFVLTLAIPLVIASMLIFISLFSVPAVVKHLERAYPDLQKGHGGSIAGSVFQALGNTVVFLLLVLVTLPLWLIPPFFALIPPVLWGWLTYRVMTYDALSEHATAEERKTLMKRHRIPLLTIGVVVGLLGSAPTLLWVWSAVIIFLFPVVLAGTLWLYVLIFIFSALWFGHYCLRALADLRAERDAAAPPAPPAGDVIDLAPSDVRQIGQS
ncbi:MULTISPECIES: EI24 domain-containing protein [unclassified Cupriavidus]|uniref:EI24 domain-containing protein n=1 Tax=unclassified Cupriavidus TaxID=2640874 RepID=UPI001BFFF309|nr:MULTISPECIES: EI24 domain-containing protein [unclassified Cupriavidus]MCA3185600.1 EI24 domain-containing protein [Cupriavidus sp.]MCA3191601.1 EI24 domain-containing protein [Cupriavidus sp.]MCA3199804.1 EI24 domain-containing protein [Cupriavidus sp.]MCA3201638.1 EI24 domain-containing protein [Cupriavidus sp.]MCA3205647.1 EI24 domain-containing protein [Cupriavidus sp.]